MNILFLTQYFPPEVGAPQNRLFELAIRLKKQGINVDVLTAMPNYPKMEIHSSYKGKFYCKDDLEGLIVHRAYIFVSKSKSIVSRLLNYFSFVITSFFVGLFKIKKQDYILCESPPLFLGISALLLCKLKGAKLIFNVSDLWPESAEKLGLVTNKTMLNSAQRLEEYLYKNSALITGQTQGIVKNIKERFPQKTVYWLPNGVDFNFFDTNQNYGNWRSKMNFEKDDLVFLYAGIIGHAQGLEVILQAASIIKEQTKIKFVLLGSGPEKEKLLELKAALNLNNVYFLESISKAEMPSVVQGCDATIVPLKKLDLFLGAIPSKIFENLAMKKPIILGVDGEARDLFINSGNAGWYFEPENSNKLAKTILHINSNKEELEQKGLNGYNYVKQNFNRDVIAENLYKQIQLLR